jgi:hypothetical protein
MADFLLLETGDYLLLETGDKLELEDGAAPPASSTVIPVIWHHLRSQHSAIIPFLIWYLLEHIYG